MSGTPRLALRPIRTTKRARARSSEQQLRIHGCNAATKHTISQMLNIGTARSAIFNLSQADAKRTKGRVNSCTPSRPSPSRPSNSSRLSNLVALHLTDGLLRDAAMVLPGPSFLSSSRLACLMVIAVLVACEIILPAAGMPYRELYEQDVRRNLRRKRSPQDDSGSGSGSGSGGGASPVPMPPAPSMAACATSNVYAQQLAYLQSLQSQYQQYQAALQQCSACAASPTTCSIQVAQVCVGGGDSSTTQAVIRGGVAAVGALADTAGTMCPTGSGFESCCQAAYEAAYNSHY